MDTKKKESHFANLVQLAAVNREITRQEKEMLLKCAERFGIAPERALEIAAEVDLMPFDAPESRSSRSAQFREYIEMVQADGSVDRAEIELLRETGRKLGFSVEQVDQALRGGDPGAPARLILTRRNRLVMEAALLGLALGFAIFGAVSLRREQAGLDRIQAEQNRIGHEIREIETEEKNAATSLALGQQKLAGIRKAIEETTLRIGLARAARALLD